MGPYMSQLFCFGARFHCFLCSVISQPIMWGLVAAERHLLYRSSSASSGATEMFCSEGLILFVKQKMKQILLINVTKNCRFRKGTDNTWEKVQFYLFAKQKLPLTLNITPYPSFWITFHPYKMKHFLHYDLCCVRLGCNQRISNISCKAWNTWRHHALHQWNRKGRSSIACRG